MSIGYTGPSTVPLSIDEAKEVVTALTLHVTAANAPIRRKFERFIEVNNDTNRPLHGSDARK